MSRANSSYLRLSIVAEQGTKIIISWTILGRVEKDVEAGSDSIKTVEVKGCHIFCPECIQRVTVLGFSEVLYMFPF